MSFVHLHVHSQYSPLMASPTIDALVQKCVDEKMPALALTDYGNLFGALELYFKCREKGIQPIIGLEVYLTQDRFKKTHEKSETVVLLVQNLTGYQNLCHLSTIGYKEGFYYLPRVDMESLQKHHEGLIALTGGQVGKILQDYQNFGEEKALDEIKKLQKIFKNRLYLEWTQTNPLSYNQFLKTTSRQLSLPLVATNDVHYVESKDYVVQDVLMCIRSNDILESRQKDDREDYSFKSPQKMKELFKENTSALETTLEIAKQCQLEFKLTDAQKNPIYHLPTPSLEKRKNLKSELEYLSQKGFQEKIKEKRIPQDQIETYKKRLEKELKIINSMGFTGYFLIVHEFVHWAKNQNIPVGPGRGSGASSLVAYCLGITALDPMKQHLLFERFLNPERISMPDFDIDFCPESRNRVIQHVTDTYGEDYVAQVITFGRLQAKAAIRDVGRVLSISYSEVDALAKLIPDKIGVTIGEAIEMNPTLKEFKETDSQISILLDLAQRIEGLVRHVSIHAAGVIIADRPIVQYAPLYRSAENENVIQFDLKYAKKIGLVKFDFLGLKTLTLIQNSLKLIEKNKGKKIQPEEIQLGDSGIYEIMNQGDTLGIFQFEGFGITDLIKKAQPKCFEDIIAINALFRPGPMDMIPSYLQRRKSKTAHYIFPELEPILKETHGVVVYQEQVLLISDLIAGYSFGEADVLRRAMGEKITSEMKKQKTRFLRGAQKKNFDPKKSEKLFDTVAEFAKYGFNKAHAAAYCMLAAQTAWIKHYYPVEFFAALMSSEMTDTSKMIRYIKNLKQRKIKIKAPHINSSEYMFSVHGDEIHFALGAIKGVGQLAVQSLLSVREKLKDKKFESLDHFLESIGKVNKKTFDSLAKAGALDGLGYSRAEITLNFETLLERAEKKKRDKISGQSDLFSFSDEKEEIHLARSEEWDTLEKLKHEKEVIGFYLNEHPLDHFKPYTRFLPSKTILEIKNKSPKNREVLIWGMIHSLKEMITRKGTPMAFAQIEDSTGDLNLIIFSKIYMEFEKLLKTDEPVYLKGNMAQGEDIPRCIVEEVIPLSLFLSKLKKIQIFIPQKTKDQSLTQLKEIISENKGETSVVFQLNVGNSHLNLVSKDPNGVHVDIHVLEKMRHLVPSENIKLI